jgi:hypothetical protein
MARQTKYPISPQDREGRQIRIGDRVRIVGVPDLRGMAESERPNTTAVFKHLVGTYRRVSSFDAFGCAEIHFIIRRGRHRGMHSVAIEPHLLLRPLTQGKVSKDRKKSDPSGRSV